MTTDQIASVMLRIPELTSYGIGIFRDHRRLSPEEVKREFDRGREELSESVHYCTTAAAWLRRQPIRKSVNWDMSSYGWKHVMERMTGQYVTNGAFIAAAVHLGIPYHIQCNSPNVILGLSQKVLRAERQLSADRSRN